MRCVLKKILCMTLLVTASSSFGESIYTDFFSDKALSGYDAVGYFSEGKPVKGLKEHKVEHLGASWFFNSAKNKGLFESDPDKYRPQYGGHCAWAVAANNAKAKGDPKYWKIVDDKLYLNYSEDVQKKWMKDIPGFIKTGNVHWPVLAGK